MRKKLGRLLERWGYYGLALLCAAVILLSALWTREQPLSPPASQALSDGSQRLSQAVSPAPSPGMLCRPTAGALLRGYSETPVFFPALSLWQAHPALDFSAEPGAPVYALAAGTLAANAEGVCVRHEDGGESLYRGVALAEKAPGQQVKAGERIGTATGSVPFEGAGHICVKLLEKDGASVNWLERIDTDDK